VSEEGEKVQDKKLSFEMYDENRTLHKCCCWYTNSWYVMYDDKNIKIEDQKSFSDVLNTFINGLHVDKYLSYFDAISETTLRNNLILPLPATARLLGFDTEWENSDFGYNIVLGNSKNVIFDRLLIFWTGDYESQPIMYYLKREMVVESEQELEELFKIGVLGKVRLLIQGHSEEYSYFVPFYSSDVNSTCWQRILEDRNIAAKNFVAKFKHPTRFF
jgi:hypothetical protein